MKAVVLNGPNDFTAVEDYPKPQIGPRDMLLEMKRTAICGTDIRILEGKKTKDVRYGHIIGHEISGVICEVGAEVEGYSVGDRVAVENVIPDGTCAMCISGHDNVCLHRQAIGYEFDGGFAEYVFIPEVAIRGGNVVKLTDNISYGEGALIEPLSCCLRGQRNAGVKFNDVVVIVGAGPIGLMHTLLAKAAGARKVIVSELNEFRRGKALECGADIVVDSANEDLKGIVMSETNGVGADVVIVAIGIPALVNPSIELVRKNGSICLFAGFTKGVKAEIDPNLIHYGEIKMCGSSAYRRQDYQEAAQMVMSGAVDMKPIITNVFKIEDFQKAYEAVKRGADLKVEIEP